MILNRLNLQARFHPQRIHCNAVKMSVSFNTGLHSLSQRNFLPREIPPKWFYFLFNACPRLKKNKFSESSFGGIPLTEAASCAIVMICSVKH